MSTLCKGGTYRVDFKVPWLARLVKVDDDLFVLQTKFLDRNVCAVRPRTTVVGVEGDFVAGAAHVEYTDVEYESGS